MMQGKILDSSFAYLVSGLIKSWSLFAANSGSKPILILGMQYPKQTAVADFLNKI